MHPIGYLPASFEVAFQRAIYRAESLLTGLIGGLPASFKLKLSRANHNFFSISHSAGPFLNRLDWLSSCFFQAKIFKSQCQTFAVQDHP
jgi:hypothetical protein